MQSSQEFRDAALVLVGHGSTVNDDSTATIYQHAAELRRRAGFAEVVEAFWKVEPKLDAVWTRITARRVFVVPLFISEGYFTEEAIPEALGLRRTGETDFARQQEREGRTIHYCRPVGTDARMTDVILARAAEVVARHPFPRAPRPADTALFIAAHGTERNRNSRASAEDQAELIRQRELYSSVHAVFMEEAPRIGTVYELATAPNLVVVPFFMSAGLHVMEDIPVLLGEAERAVKARSLAGIPTWRNPTEKHGKRVWYADCVGTEPRLVDVILDRVQEEANA